MTSWGPPGRDLLAGLHRDLRHAIGPGCASCGRGDSGRGKGGFSRSLTRGHDVPSQLRVAWRVWLPQCSACNGDQCDRTYLEWGLDMVGDEDPRALRVLLVAELLASWATAAGRGAADTAAMLRWPPTRRRSYGPGGRRTPLGWQPPDPDEVVRRIRAMYG